LAWTTGAAATVAETPHTPMPAESTPPMEFGMLRRAPIHNTMPTEPSTKKPIITIDSPPSWRSSAAE
jgi:hypothetical protein